MTHIHTMFVMNPILLVNIINNVVIVYGGYKINKM